MGWRDMNFNAQEFCCSFEKSAFHMECPINGFYLIETQIKRIGSDSRLSIPSIYSLPRKNLRNRYINERLEAMKKKPLHKTTASS
jgi:hypothetical protein